MNELQQDSSSDLTDFEKYQLLRYKVLEENLVEIWKVFEKQNVEPILIKGWAASRFYPKPFSRPHGDIDLAVAPEQYEKALEIQKSDPKFFLDIHRGLRHLDILAWEDLFANSQKVKCADGFIRVLRPEDHLRVLCVHWLTDGGAFKEKLLDIVYLVKNRPPDFDWERCLNSVGKKRRKWVLMTIGLARKYFDLNVEDLPFANETEDLPKWLIKAVEKEWKSDVRLLPLHTVLRQKQDLWRQIKKRIPPNAIQATIDVEGDFDHKPRLFYQIGSIFVRLIPSLKRIFSTVNLSKSSNS